MAERRIERVCQHVKRVCNTERHGGQCFVINDLTCVLHHYDEWNSDMHDKLKTKFPDVDIVCTHNAQSATSLSVVFTVQPRASIMLAAMVLMAIVVFCASVCVQVMLDWLVRCGCEGMRCQLLRCRVGG